MSSLNDSASEIASCATPCHESIKQVWIGAVMLILPHCSSTC